MKPDKGGYWNTRKEKLLKKYEKYFRKLHLYAAILCYVFTF